MHASPLSHSDKAKFMYIYSGNVRKKHGKIRKGVSKNLLIIIFYFKESLFTMCNDMVDCSLIYYSYLVISSKSFKNSPLFKGT